MLMDARKFERPVNYAIVKIIPPPDVTVDPKRRPYIIIDPERGVVRVLAALKTARKSG
jgi:hypothetical protein